MPSVVRRSESPPCIRLVTCGIRTNARTGTENLARARQSRRVRDTTQGGDKGEGPGVQEIKGHQESASKWTGPKNAMNYQSMLRTLFASYQILTEVSWEPVI